MKWPAPPAAWSRTASTPSSARISARPGAVQKEDDIVDGLFDTVKNELVGQITEHPDLSGECLDLLMIAKYLERIGDHAVNVAEWVEYSITGAHAGE